jgi:type I restriction enzyme, S subunit
MKNWNKVKLKKILTQCRETIWLDDLTQYNQLTNSKHSGIQARGYKLGGEIGRKRQFLVDLDKYPNTILYTRQTIQTDEAIALCPYEVNGCIVTENMPLFSIQNADPKFVEYFFKTELFLRQLHQTAAIGTSQQSILEEIFLEYEISLPPLAEQQRIVARLSALKNKIDEVKILRGEQEKDSKNLLYSLFLNTIKNAKWLKMGEVAPLIKRQVELQPNQFYNEIGARSFGKGTFDKPIVNSNDLTWQKPNWIKTGDLLFSNIKAWEGAIATVSEKDNNKIGSHRYLTFVPNPEIIITEFLCFYFLTHEGLDKVSDASPGSADRNRTLNTKKIFNALVPVPTLEAQQKFLRVQAQLNATKQYQSEQMTLLNGIFPSLLNKAFRGEL